MMDLTSPTPVPGDLQLKPCVATIVSVLRERAALNPDKKAFTFLAIGEDETGSITYGELNAGARNIALKLTALDLNGKNVLMFYPPGLDFIMAFFGCLYSGTIPVTAYPPRKNRSMHRIHMIAADCSANSILTTEAIGRSLERNFSEDALLASLSWHATDTWPQSDPSVGIPDIPAKPGFEDLAFLQYTSGSTGDPKGVMISHLNLMFNLRSLQMIFRITPDDIAVHWVPQFHDLGLIFGILETVFSGSLAVLIPPLIFISNPFFLLNAISRYQATVSGQPDFAFNHCVDKIDEIHRKSLDLSSLRIMYSGAEPVRKSTLDRFLSAFSPVGLKPETLIPAYGMAESTLILTGAVMSRPTFYLPVRASGLEQNTVIPLLNDDKGSDIQWVASNGKPVMDTSIMIVDPETREIQPPLKVGEIWAKGSTIGMGYWANPLLSENVFRASPAGKNDPAWLRTGDLGFLYNDELFITGRQKDLIIVHGRNFYPQDIEELTEMSHTAVRKNCAAAFSIERNGEEKLVVVAELQRTVGRKDMGKIIEAIVASISREFEIQPSRITFIRYGSLPKTSSGKIMRRSVKELLVGGKMEIISEKIFEDKVIYSSQDETGIQSLEQFLISWISAHLNNGLPVDPANSLATYGIDSMKAVLLVADTESRFGFEWPPYLFFEEISIAQLVVEGQKLMEEI